MPFIATMTADDLQQSGPLVKVEIGNPSDPSKTAIVAALIDTGAAFSAINPQLAQSCRLIQRSRKKIHVLGNTGPEDAKEYPEFAASLTFPETDLRGFKVHGIVACPIFEKKFSCLIGRDLLRFWEVTYSGSLGQFSIKDSRYQISDFD